MVEGKWLLAEFGRKSDVLAEERGWLQEKVMMDRAQKTKSAQWWVIVDTSSHFLSSQHNANLSFSLTGLWNSNEVVQVLPAVTIGGVNSCWLLLPVMHVTRPVFSQALWMCRAK